MIAKFYLHKVKGGEIVMNIFYFIGIAIVFCILQFVLSTKTDNALIKYLFISVTAIGLIFSFVLYLNVFWPNSSSVIAENQYFARFISVPLGAGFIGCLLGLLIYRLLNKTVNNN